MAQNNISLKASRLSSVFLSLDDRDDCILSQLLFFLPFCVWVTVNILFIRTTFATTLKPLVNYQLFQIFCIATLAVREVLFGKWDRLSFFGLLLLAIMSYASLNGNMTLVFESMCFVFSARNLPFRRIALVAFCLLALIIIVTVASALTGIIVDTTITRKSHVRHHLGFGHPNTCNALLFFVFCLWVYLRKDKFNFGDAIGIIAIAVTFYLLTDSRTSFALAIGLSILAFVIRFIPPSILKSPAIAIILIGSVVFLAGISIGITYYFDPSVGWMKSLNSIFSNRLALGHRAIAENGIPAFGQVVDFTRPTRYDFTTGTYISSGDKALFIVDCAYVRLAVSCGWVYIIIGIIIATVSNIRLYQKKEWHLLIVITFIALHGMTESYLYNGTMNVFLLLLGSLFYLPSWIKPIQGAHKKGSDNESGRVGD